MHVAFKQDRAMARIEQTKRYPERRLPRAALAHQGDGLASGNREADRPIVVRARARCASAERLGDAPNVQQRCNHGRSTLPPAGAHSEP